MKGTIGLIAAFSLVAQTGAASSAHAQAVSKSTLSGTAFTANATSNNNSVMLYTAPAARAGVAMITSVCGSVVATSSQSHIQGSTLGLLAISTANGCVQFPLGLALPAGEVLTYANPGAFEANTTITGIVSKK